MTDSYDSLVPLGWDPGWANTLAATESGAEAGRVLQHHGVALVLALPGRTETLMLTTRLEPQPTVGDWIAVRNGEAVAVLPRRSLLRRRNAHGDGEQQLGANIDKVLLVCGLDRPVKDGRIQRGTAISRDAGAIPVVVLTKASRDSEIYVDPQRAAAEVRSSNPGIDVIVTSVKEGIGIDEIRSIIGRDTVTLLGESGAGKSSIVNALIGNEVAETGEVRESDSKGRHTTTTRELHLLPGGGVLIDTPGIRAVGLLADNDGVAETFADVDDIACTCRFADCQHEGQPGCAIAAALAAGELNSERVDQWRRLEAETDSSEPVTPRLSAPPRRSRRPDGM
ncbi:MAG: ribosome small subunit-dependent GTPase A [Acidimicrobiales bacterium]